MRRRVPLALVSVTTCQLCVHKTHSTKALSRPSWVPSQAGTLSTLLCVVYPDQYLREHHHGGDELGVPAFSG